MITLGIMIKLTVICVDLIKYEKLVTKVRDISEEYQKKYGADNNGESNDKHDDTD